MNEGPYIHTENNISKKISNFLDSNNDTKNYKLVRYAKSGNVEMLKWIFENQKNYDYELDINARKSALKWASYYGHYDAVEVILDSSEHFFQTVVSGACQDARLAALRQGHKKILILLDKHKNASSITDMQMSNLLFYAYFEQKLDCLKALFCHKAELKQISLENYMTDLYIDLLVVPIEASHAKIGAKASCLELLKTVFQESVLDKDVLMCFANELLDETDEYPDKKLLKYVCQYADPEKVARYMSALEKECANAKEKGKEKDENKTLTYSYQPPSSRQQPTIDSILTQMVKAIEQGDLKTLEFLICEDKTSKNVEEAINYALVKQNCGIVEFICNTAESNLAKPLPSTVIPNRK